MLVMDGILFACSHPTQPPAKGKGTTPRFNCLPLLLSLSSLATYPRASPFFSTRDACSRSTSLLHSRCYSSAHSIRSSCLILTSPPYILLRNPINCPKLHFYHLSSWLSYL